MADSIYYSALLKPFYFIINHFTVSILHIKLDCECVCIRTNTCTYTGMYTLWFQTFTGVLGAHPCE